MYGTSEARRNDQMFSPLPGPLIGLLFWTKINVE